MRTKARSPAVLLLLAALALPAAAERSRTFIDEPEPVGPDLAIEPQLWEEGSAPLPPWPRDEDLVEFRIDAGSGAFRWFVDTRHLSVGADEVVRYTLVAQSRDGARNVSFEGIRCTPRGVYKVYAYGSGGDFHRAPPGDWQPIHDWGSDNYRRDLHASLLCVPLKFEPRPKKDMIRALQGRSAARENTGFMAD